MCHVHAYTLIGWTACINEGRLPQISGMRTVLDYGKISYKNGQTDRHDKTDTDRQTEANGETQGDIPGGKTPWCVGHEATYNIRIPK